MGEYERYLERDREQDEREKANYEKALDLEKQQVSVVEKERDLAMEKAELYQTLYEAVRQGPGFGCWMKRIFSFGIHRCR